MPTLPEIIRFLDSFGLSDVIIPFLIVFTIVFAVLEKTRVLGAENNKPKTKLNSMLAFVVAFLTIASVDMVRVIDVISSSLALVLVAAVLLAMIFGLLGVEEVPKNNVFLSVALILVSVVGLYALSSAGLIDVAPLQPYFAPVIIIAVFLALLYFLLRESKQPSREPDRRPEPTPPPRPVPPPTS